ncbi:MAG: carbamoyltransferase [Planctomycetes bacterium]|nr:carbamoyltransferase [Planctomycetota bacterium]
MTAILGISAYYHDSAAALIRDGEIIAAAQEERFSRRKHDPAFPAQAIQYCLSEAGITAAELDFVGFYDKPWLKFERLLETYLAFAPKGLRSFRAAIPVWVQQKLFLRREMQRGLGPNYRGNFVFTEHHESHAASAFFPSPFQDAAILTVDGVGEWATASYGVGRGNRLQLSHELRFPHSPGLLYSAFTQYCGFKVNSGEYKLMGLAPYGEPRFVDRILDKLIDLKQDGSFRMDMRYFAYCDGLSMISPAFEQLFGAPRRTPETPITESLYMDVAASIQKVIEEILLRMARHVHRETGMRQLCLAGGVALNCVANGRVLREGPFDEIWIQPAAGDAGGAVGVATFIWHQLLDKPRGAQPTDRQHGSLLGPRPQPASIRSLLDRESAVYHEFDSDEELCEHVAELIAQEKVVGWMQGRMEFGPRALGARSILGDARSPRMQSVMNQKIKFRESFRPFAPSVLQEHVDEYFATRPAESSPYMLLVADLRPDKRLPVSPNGPHGIDRLKQLRSIVPAVTHVDYSARIQTVDPERHGRYYQLLQAFARRTGVPILINTSFNIRGEPIVCRPEEAYRCFLSTDIDVLVLDRFVLRKDQQPVRDQVERQKYLEQFHLD